MVKVSPREAGSVFDGKIDRQHQIEQTPMNDQHRRVERAAADFGRAGRAFDDAPA
jgi:hypothetical protein